MAGLGTRLRPLTWSKPKPLISVAGSTVLGHFLQPILSLPELEEVVFVVGYLGDQIEDYVAEHYPALNARFVVQEQLSGQSHAIWLARHGLEGPALIGFVDTLIETEFSVLADEAAEALIWVREVEDPRRFGVVEIGSEDWVKQLVEKPENPTSNLAVVGFYYFRQAERLIDAIQHQMDEGAMLKGEYFLADAINVLLEGGLSMRAVQVDGWHDAGTRAAILATNRYLLDHGRNNSPEIPDGVIVEPPVFLDASATVSRSVIGPYASIGADCVVEHASIRDSIVEAGSQIKDSKLTDSLIGRACRVQGTDGSLNIGDFAEVAASV